MRKACFSCSLLCVSVSARAGPLHTMLHETARGYLPCITSGLHSYIASRFLDLWRCACSLSSKLDMARGALLSREVGVRLRVADDDSPSRACLVMCRVESAVSGAAVYRF